MKALTGNEKLAKAKTALIFDSPFFASLFLNMPMIEDSSIKTFATDGVSIRYSPQFLETMDVSEITFVLGHEVMHVVFEHMFRIGEKDHATWNEAADYVINGLLVAEGLGRMPPIGLLNPDLVKQGGGTAEGVYEILYAKKQKEKPKDDGEKDDGQGAALDSMSAPTQDAAELSKIQAETKIKVIQARNAAKAAGSLSAGLERLVKELVKSRVDWKAALRRFLSEKDKVDLSFAKPKRRFLAEDICLPSLTGEKVGPIVVAVDCSGSIDEKLLSKFSAEIQAIAEDTNPAEVRVIYFDYKVLKTQVFSPDEFHSLKLSPVGGGGTAFSPVFTELNSYETAPKAVVFLTDLLCDDFGPMPDYPVLWASTRDSEKVPFGEVLLIDEKGK